MVTNSYEITLTIRIAATTIGQAIQNTEAAIGKLNAVVLRVDRAEDAR